MFILKFLGKGTLSLVFLLAISASACSQSSLTIESHYKVSGAKNIAILQQQISGTEGLTFFAPHSSETTSVDAVTALIKKGYAANLFWIENNGARNISFQYDGEKYEFDPNRMFTDIGIKKTLQKYGNYSKDAHGIVKHFAQDVVRQVFERPLRKKVIVTLHNNTEGNYSVASYVKGGVYEKDASAVFVNPDRDVDDFYFVTSQRLYDHFKSKSYNVVLQSKTVTDDGSLSVYAAQKGIAYINVEAQHGHIKMQKEMIELLGSL